MKKVLLPLTVLVLSCNSYKKDMNNLLSKKSILEDSIKNLDVVIYRLDELSKTQDSNSWKPTLKKLAGAEVNKIDVVHELKKIEYSIDSLQKLK